MSPETARQKLTLEPDKIRRILAVRLDNIGDVVMLGPSLRALRAAFPLAKITLMASPAGSQVAPLLPWIDEVFTWRALWQDVSGGLAEQPERELELVEKLRQGQYDAAFIFTSFSQSPYPPGYACYLAGIPIRVGHSKEFGGGVLNITGAPPPDSGHQTERSLALLERAGIPVKDRSLELFIPPQVQAQADQLLEQAGIDPYAPFIAAAPGASCTARRYDPARFADALRLLVQKTGLPALVLGSEREKETLAPFIEAPEALRPWVSLVGKTDVGQLAAVIRRSGLVLANNSASLHFADAFQRPMVITYSGTEYLSQWEPRVSPARLLRCETDCSPCYQFTCPFQMECLDLSPEQVAEAALDLLQTIDAQALNQGTPSPNMIKGNHLFY